MYLTAVENVVDIIPTQIIANLLYIAVLAKIISIYHVLKKNARIMVRKLNPLTPEYRIISTKFIPPVKWLTTLYFYRRR